MQIVFFTFHSSFFTLMTRLPVSLEKKLQMLFPRAAERNQFITETLSAALENKHPSELDQPLMVGGTLHLFSDGGSRGNPGQAAIGIVLFDPLKNEVIREYGEAIGIVTNNIAEYQALIAGLKIAKEFQPNHLICHLDSELVVKQLSGEYRVKMPSFQPLIAEINDLKSNFPTTTFRYIPRGENRRADLLVNRALDDLEKGKKPMGML